MKNFLSFESRNKTRASFIWFSLFVVAHPIVMFVLLRSFYKELWERELSFGIVAIGLSFLLWQALLCFGEFFFHRYVLHIVTAPFLKDFAKKHRAHHALTSISVDGGDGGGHTVRSSYAISTLRNDEFSTFPPWALSLFFGFMWFLFVFFGTINSHFLHHDRSTGGFPIFIGAYSALAALYYSYETLHMLHHKPHSWWEQKISDSGLRKFWLLMYGFHQAHHANPACNMAIGGFFGLPLADWSFGTYKQPRVLLLDGVAAKQDDVVALTPKPVWPISWLDKFALKLELKILGHNGSQ